MSASLGKEDRWSDIDIAFGVRDATELPNVIKALTDYLYSHCNVAHHFDMPFGDWVYRVFFSTTPCKSI